MKTWNQAAWKQNTYSKRVAMKPVGDEVISASGDGGCCRACGYFVHAPTCPSQRARQTSLPKPSEVTKEWKVQGVDHALPGSDCSVAALVTLTPTGGLAVNSMTLRQRMDLDPSDEEIGGLNSVEQDDSPSLTLEQVAKLPIGTKVVVECGDECFPTGTGLTFDGWVSASRVSFVEDVSGTRWTVTFEEAKCFTFKVVR